jgi:thioredoxin
MSKVRPVTEEELRSEILESSAPLFVDFYATWCAPCRTMAPVLDELAEEYAGRIRFVKVDVEEETALAEALGITSVPTLVLVRGGTVLALFKGAVPAHVLRPKLDEALAEEEA